MDVIVKKTPPKKDEIKELRMKAGLFDELVDFLEEKVFGELMRATEGEPNIPLAEAKKLLK